MEIYRLGGSSSAALGTDRGIAKADSAGNPWLGLFGFGPAVKWNTLREECESSCGKIRSEVSAASKIGVAFVRFHTPDATMRCLMKNDKEWFPNVWINVRPISAQAILKSGLDRNADLPEQDDAISMESLHSIFGAEAITETSSLKPLVEFDQRKASESRRKSTTREEWRASISRSLKRTMEKKSSVADHEKEIERLWYAQLDWLSQEWILPLVTLWG